MDDKGVWGPWSSIWSFTPRGPASPVDVALAVDADRSVGTLRWKPNPEVARDHLQPDPPGDDRRALARLGGGERLEVPPGDRCGKGAQVGVL